MGVLKDPLEVQGRESSIYPEPFGDVVKGRFKRALGNALGLNNFGVNMVHLAPGGATAQRHWHEKQDELVYVLEGEATLITDAGEQVLTAGMICGFPAGEADGHHIVNNSDATVVLLEVGDRTPGEVAHYPDIDLHGEVKDGRFIFTHKDGRPYDQKS